MAQNLIQLEGPAGQLGIPSNDEIALKLAMLFEGQCLGVTIEQTARKFGCTRQNYYLALKAFRARGSAGLISQKTGPKSKSVRKDEVVTQIVRHRFLDPQASCEVIAQKMRQAGLKVSRRSVERTITDYGLQKKTLSTKTPPDDLRDPDRSAPNQETAGHD